MLDEKREALEKEAAVSRGSVAAKIKWGGCTERRFKIV